jgi:hypothetical protein
MMVAEDSDILTIRGVGDALPKYRSLVFKITESIVPH